MKKSAIRDLLEEVPKWVDKQVQNPKSLADCLRNGNEFVDMSRSWSLGAWQGPWILLYEMRRHWKVWSKGAT